MTTTATRSRMIATSPTSSCTEQPTMKLLVTTAHPSLHQHPGPAGELTHPNLGRLIQPRHTSSIEATAEAGITWAADNDCFQGLDERRYVAMLHRIAGLEGCAFVTVPDVVADAAATRRLFDTWHRVVRATGQPVAMVLQDGQSDVGVPWELIDAVFIGGSNEFKDGPEAAAYAREAKARGRWVHWGRVNGKTRFNSICEAGHFDSCDGSKWARWRKTYLDTGLEWCRTLHAS